MKLRSKRALAAVAAVAALAVVVTGCGSKAASGSGSAGAESTVIKIGVGAPLTQGAVAQGQGIKRGALLAIKEANESDAAKKLGITFEGVDGDDQADPKTGVTVANQFASDMKLVGVVGHQNSGVSIPASKVYNEAKIVQITPASTNPALTTQGFPNVFRTCTIDSVQGPAAADAAFKEVGAKTAVVIDDSTPYGEGLAAEFARQFIADGGKVIFQEKTSDKDSDFNALATKIKSKNPDIIYYGGVYNAGALLAKQTSDAGVTAPMMSGDACFDPEYINLAGKDQAEGDLVTSVGLPTDKLPKGQEFQAAFKAEYPSNEIGAYDAYAYDAAKIIIDSVLKVAEAQGADKVTSPAGRDAIIAAVAAFNGEGVTGKISFDKNGDTTNKAITVYRAEGGAWKPFIVPEQ